MKKLTIILLIISLKVSASGPIVQAQKTRHVLTNEEVGYILSKTANYSIRYCLLSNQQTIRNNDVADNILLILKMKKQDEKVINQVQRGN